MAGITGHISMQTAEVGNAPARGVHVVTKPTDVGANGQYRHATQTGLMVAGMVANSEVYQFRWPDATRLCVVKKVRVTMASTTAFTAGPATIRMTRATGFSALGSTGGVVTTPSSKLRSSHPASLVGANVITANTGPITVVGTKTFDSTDLSIVTVGISATAGPIVVPEYIYLCNLANGEHPLVLAQNEGFILRMTVPATGTFTASVEVRWAEVEAF